LNEIDENSNSEEREFIEAGRDKLPEMPPPDEGTDELNPFEEDIPEDAPDADSLEVVGESSEGEGEPVITTLKDIEENITEARQDPDAGTESVPPDGLEDRIAEAGKPAAERVPVKNIKYELDEFYEAYMVQELGYKKASDPYKIKFRIDLTNATREGQPAGFDRETNTFDKQKLEEWIQENYDTIHFNEKISPESEAIESLKQKVEYDEKVALILGILKEKVDLFDKDKGIRSFWGKKRRKVDEEGFDYHFNPEAVMGTAAKFKNYIPEKQLLKELKKTLTGRLGVREPEIMANIQLEIEENKDKNLILTDENNEGFSSSEKDAAFKDSAGNLYYDFKKTIRPHERAVEHGEAIAEEMGIDPKQMRYVVSEEVVKDKLKLQGIVLDAYNEFRKPEEGKEEPTWKLTPAMIDELADFVKQQAQLETTMIPTPEIVEKAGEIVKREIGKDADEKSRRYIKDAEKEKKRIEDVIAGKTQEDAMRKLDRDVRSFCSDYPGLNADEDFNPIKNAFLATNPKRNDKGFYDTTTLEILASRRIIDKKATEGGEPMDEKPNRKEFTAELQEKAKKYRGHMTPEKRRVWPAYLLAGAAAVLAAITLYVVLARPVSGTRKEGLSKEEARQVTAEFVDGRNYVTNESLDNAVAQITGTINSKHEETSEMISGVESRLTERMDSDYDAASERDAALERRLTERMDFGYDAASQREAALREELTGLIDSSSDEASQLIAALQRQFTAALASDYKTASDRDAALKEMIESARKDWNDAVNTIFSGFAIYRREIEKLKGEKIEEPEGVGPGPEPENGEKPVVENGEEKPVPVVENGEEKPVPVVENGEKEPEVKVIEPYERRTGLHFRDLKILAGGSSDEQKIGNITAREMRKDFGIDIYAGTSQIQLKIGAEGYLGELGGDIDGHGNVTNYDTGISLEDIFFDGMRARISLSRLMQTRDYDGDVHIDGINFSKLGKLRGYGAELNLEDFEIANLKGFFNASYSELEGKTKVRTRDLITGNLLAVDNLDTKFRSYELNPGIRLASFENGEGGLYLGLIYGKTMLKEDAWKNVDRYSGAEFLLKIPTSNHSALIFGVQDLYHRRRIGDIKENGWTLSGHALFEVYW